MGVETLNIQDLLLPQPLPAIVGIMLFFGIKTIAGTIQKLFIKTQQDALDEALWFFSVLAIISVIYFFLSFLQVAYLTVLRVLSTAIISYGLIGLILVFIRKKPKTIELKIPEYIRDVFKKRIVLIILPLALFLLYYFFSLSPAHETDSLHYHLGVPLDIIRNHGLINRPDWFAFHLAGLGEQINLIGLSVGTDVIGSFLQFVALYYLIKAILGITVVSQNRQYILISIISIPVFASIIATQKYQLLPSVCITLALIAFLTQNSKNRHRLILGSILIFFAIGCKYSYLFTGFIVFLIGLYVAIKDKSIKLYAISCILSFALLVLPLFIKNIIYLKDPLFPFLSKLIDSSPASYQRFAVHIRDWKDNKIPVPLNLILPDSIGMFTTILGLAFLNYILLIKYLKNRNIFILFIGSICAIVLLSLVGPKLSRYFIEPILWVACGLAFVDNDLSTKTKSLAILLEFQMLGVFLFTLLEASILIPGIFTNQLREKALSRRANDFKAIEWVNEKLPREAVAMINSWNLSFPKNVFVSTDIVVFSDLHNAEEENKILSILDEKDAEYIVLRKYPQQSPESTSGLVILQQRYFPYFVTSSNLFSQSTRSPFKNPPQFLYEIYSKTPQ